MLFGGSCALIFASFRVDFPLGCGWLSTAFPLVPYGFHNVNNTLEIFQHPAKAHDSHIVNKLLNIPTFSSMPKSLVRLRCNKTYDCQTGYGIRQLTTIGTDGFPLLEDGLVGCRASRIE